MKFDKPKADIARKSLLSTLWIFILLNMVYADILGMLRPGYVDFLDHMGQQLSGSTVLFFAILMEIPIAMIFLSRVLAYRANRWAHFIAIPLTVLWVVVPALMSSLGETTPLSYIFFASVEVITMLIMLWHISKWPQPAREQGHSW